MANEQNLKPSEYKLTQEEAKRGGINSGKSRREARRRGELWKELVNTEITNEEMIAELTALGVTDEHPTFEQYIKAKAIKDMMKNAKIQDVRALDDELYGPLEKRQQLELSGEISGININIKKYDKDGNGSRD